MRFLLASLLLAAACAHAPHLVPAPDAPRAPGNPNAAVASAAGVRITVDSQRWLGEPHDLDSIVTPLHVVVENESASPIRIRYRDFSLFGADGMQTTAIPPFRIVRPGSGAVAVMPPFTPHGFLLLRPYGPWYPGVPLWDGRFDWDPVFYDQLYETWEPALPTSDMLTQALPEGVLQPGGRVEGFLYVHKLKQDSGRVIFTADLFDANTQGRIATLRIPMTVK